MLGLLFSFVTGQLRHAYFEFAALTRSIYNVLMMNATCNWHNATSQKYNDKYTHLDQSNLVDFLPLLGAGDVGEWL